MLQTLPLQKKIALHQTRETLGTLLLQIETSENGIPAGFVESLVVTFNSYLFEDADCRNFTINIRLLRVAQQLAVRYSQVSQDDRSILRYCLRFFWPVAGQMVREKPYLCGRYRQALKTLGMWESLTPPPEGTEVQDEVAPSEGRAASSCEDIEVLHELNRDSDASATSSESEEPSQPPTPAPSPCKKRKMTNTVSPSNTPATVKHAKVARVEFPAGNWGHEKPVAWDRIEEREGEDRCSGCVNAGKVICYRPYWRDKGLRCAQCGQIRRTCSLSSTSGVAARMEKMGAS